MFDKGFVYFPINGKYFKFVTVLNILTYPSKNKHLLVMNYANRKFRLRALKPKLINARVEMMINNV